MSQRLLIEVITYMLADMDFDIPNLVGAIDRTVLTPRPDGPDNWGVAATRTYPNDIADVWDALTSAERIPRWLMPITGDLRLGGRYQLEGNAGGEITACEPPEHFAATWEFGGDTSWIDVRLERVAEGTRLHLEHTAPGPSEHWDEFGPGAVGIGWDLSLIGLGEHLMTGRPVDVDEAAMASPEGVALMRASSAAWTEAAIAAGTPADAARAAGERCTAAYTG
jgi:uncharacterized protein YndB with AHSA1/START domain